jgi:phosphohistidine phosphatase
VKYLLVLRHASPERAAPDGSDFSRPLTPRGVEEARIQGLFLQHAGILPDRVFSSHAARARQTAEILCRELQVSGRLELSEDLYNASGEELLTFLQQVPETLETVLIVAHMPGVAELMSLLTGQFHEVSMPISPCTLAAVSLVGDPAWAELGDGAGVLEWLLPPLLAER